jgi:hypothetical protein
MKRKVGNAILGTIAPEMPPLEAVKSLMLTTVLYAVSISIQQT